MNSQKSKIKKLILPILFGLVIGSFLLGGTALALDTGIGYGSLSGLGTQDLRVSIMQIVRAILGFLGILAIVIVLYGGFVWMTAGGNAERIATAKKILTNAVIGLVIIFTSFAITSFVINQLISATGAGPGGIGPNSCDEAGEVGNINGCYVCSDFGANFGWEFSCGIPGCCFGEPECGVVNISPASPPNQPMNTVARVRFSLNNITNIDDIEIINTTTGQPVDVTRIVVNDIVELRPTAFCPAPQDTLNCFDANTAFEIVVNAGAIQCGGINLVCGGFPDPCQGGFTTGDFIDVEVPTISLIDSQICQGTTNDLRALVNDDYGIDSVRFFDNTNSVLINTDINVSVPPEGFASVNWDTSSYGINEFISVEAQVFDYDNHTAVDQLQFTVRAGHCCNAVQDADETGLNCGGNDCEACSPVIEWVSPLDGNEGNIITVHGRHFGNTPGTLTFLGEPNDGGADDQDGIDPVAVNQQCVGYWTDNEIVSLVPDAQDGAMMVRASNGTLDTTNESPGNNIADFDRNNIDRPGICAVAPISSEPNVAVLVNGVRLDPGSQVYFSAVLAGGNPVGDGLTINGATVPNLNPAQVGLRVKNGDEFSNPKTFTVLGVGTGGEFQCSSDPFSCSPDNTKCTPDTFCNSSCNCEPRQLCDSDVGTPTCEADQGLCDPGWFCYKPQPDGPHQIDNTKLACHCYQASFCDDPTQPASGDNPLCHPNDGICPDNYTCDPNSNCTCQPVASFGDDSAYGWFFQSGIKPGSCSTDAGICSPDSTLCGNSEVCDPTSCTCEPVGQNTCSGSSDPNVCSPDQSLCETGTFCSDQCTCEELVPCDANPDSPSCEPSACAQSYFCYSASVDDPGYDPNKLDCYCYPGILCDGDISTPICDPDSAFCPDDYECNRNSCFCEAESKVSDSSTYTWFFNTTSFGPRVVESCTRTNTCAIDSYSSPSPYNIVGTRAGGYTVSGARPDDGAIPVDSIITAMFTTEMYANSINESSVVVFRCNSASEVFNPTACSAQQIIDDNGIDVHNCDYAGQQVSCFDFEPSALLTKNYWYQVTLSTGQIIGINGVNLIGNSVDGNYRWVFKTRDSDELSRVACVYVEPTYQTAHSLNEENEWTAYVSPEDFVCVLMNPDRACTWNWTTGDGRAIISDQLGNNATTTALIETLPDPPVDIIAQCTFSDGQKDGEGKLTIDLTSPYVIDKFPDCGTACLNARIGATFSRAMNDTSVTDAMSLYICYNDPTCEISPNNEVTSFNKPTTPSPSPPEAPHTYIGDMPCFDINNDLKMDYCLLPDTYYRVVINNTAISANDNKSLAGLNFDNPMIGAAGELDAYSWIFKTQADAGLCLPSRIDVAPENHLAPVDTIISYVSRPRTAGDACDPEFGQRLNPFVWSWDYDTNLISRQFDSPYCSGYEVANLNASTKSKLYCTDRTPNTLRKACGNGVIEVGESCDDGNFASGDGCNSNCLHEGTVNPTCGNGQINAGEECETPGTNYCGADCLWEGNTDYTLEVCGNGVVEFSEMCEYPNTSGCGPTCLYSGTVAGAICGNGVLDKGEECDEGERLSGNVPSSGDFNSDGISCSANCLVENRSIGVCRSLATNIFDFSQNSGSCNVGYVAVFLNTATGNSNAGSVCGNRITELGEQCDLGGRCSDNNKPCTTNNLSNCSDPTTAICEPRDTYCFDPGEVTDGSVCANPQTSCGVNGICIQNTCTVECLNAGSPSGFYPNNISPYQLALAIADGETNIQSWIGGYSPAATGPMGEGHLLVGNGNGNEFLIIERWPDCGSACLNADIGARFSKSADSSTVIDNLSTVDLANDRIFLYECGLDQTCDITGKTPVDVTVDSYSEHITNDAFRINLPLFYNLVDHDNNPATLMVNALLQNASYRVVVRNDVMSQEGLSLSGLNFDDPYFSFQNPDTGSTLDSHSWVFRTQDTTELCSIDSVSVNPDDYYSPSGVTILYSSEPRSEPDVCDPRYGQRLNPFYYDWDWDDVEITGNPSSLPPFLNAAEFALPLRDGCGNGVLQRSLGESCDDGNLDSGDGCSSFCLNEGSAPPVCGNGRIDRGEECDTPGVNYCGNNCLLVGNTNYTTFQGGYNLVDVCGNGIIEPGEECDEGNEPNGNETDGCNDFCRFTGSVPAAQAICGDGQIGLGEECDGGELAAGSSIVSGDGCTGTDITTACTGLNRTSCTAFPTANTCYWTGSLCKTRPCLLENKNVNICRSDRTNEFDFNKDVATCEINSGICSSNGQICSTVGSSCDSNKGICQDDNYTKVNLSTISGNNNFDLPICGNRIIEAGEQCDLGGRCSDNGRRCTPIDLGGCANPQTATCELALGICTSDGKTCNVIGSACGAGGVGTCFLTGCSNECLNVGSVEDSLLRDGLIDPYQLVETLSTPTTLGEVNEEIKAWASIQPDAVGTGLLHVVPGSQVDFAVIGHQPPVGSANQCLNVGIWALLSRPLNVETLAPDSIKLCDGVDCSLVKDYSYRIIQGQCGDDNYCHFPKLLSDVDSFGVCHTDNDCVGSQLTVRSLNTDTGFLDSNKNYEVRVDRSVLEDANGTTLAEAGTCDTGLTPCEWSFTSGTDFCECEYVSVSINPTTGGAETIKDLFTCSADNCGTNTVTPFDDDAADGNPATEQNLSGNQHLYDAVCYDIHNDTGGRIPLLPTGLRFEWAVFPDQSLISSTRIGVCSNDGTVGCTEDNIQVACGTGNTCDYDFINDDQFVTPENKNGDSDVYITAHEYHCGNTPNFCDPQNPSCSDCASSKAVSQTVRVTNFMCSNPWPGIDGPNFQIFEDSDTNCDDGNNCYDTNYMMLYCRDNGTESFSDDLPALYRDPLTLGNNPASPSIKDFIFTFAETNINQTVNQRSASNKLWGGGLGSSYQFTVAQTGDYAVKIDGYNYPTAGWGNSADLSSRVQPNPSLFDSAVNYNGFELDVYLRTGDCTVPATEKSGTAVLLPHDVSDPQSDTVSLGQLTAGENYCIYFDWQNEWCKCNPECSGTLADQCDANFNFTSWQILSENTSDDAIGVRVLENPLHLSPTTWYQSGLCGGAPTIENICFSNQDCLVSDDLTLLAHYPLDNSGNDATGKFNASVNNTPFTLAGKLGGAANFTGSFNEEYLEVSDLSNDLKPTDEITVAAWVKFTGELEGATGGVDGRIVASTHYYIVSPQGGKGWTLGQEKDSIEGNVLHFRIWGDDGTGSFKASNASSWDFYTNYVNQWVHLVGVYSRAEGKVKLYINGQLVESNNSTVTNIAYNNSTPLRIGQRADANSGQWQGQIDDVRIYNRALSDAEVAALSSTSILECQFNVPTRGNPQQIVTDNYQSIAEGRTVYVGATNRRANALWSNIYLISYNQSATPETVEIFNRLLDPEQIAGRWSFNTNIANHRVCEIYGYYENTQNICNSIGTSNFDYCSALGTQAACNADAAVYGCYWDDSFDVCLGKICQPIYCENNFECPNLSCNANKEKIVRDAERYGDLRDLQLALNRLGQNRGSYPTLGGGTYVSNTSFSEWPSWQQTLGAEIGGRLYTDPLNRFVGCSTHYCDENENDQIDSGERTFCLAGDVLACGNKPYRCIAADPDQEVTCWDEIAKQFSCPAGMYSYAYHAVNNGANYALYTTFEYDQVGSWRSLPGYFCDSNTNGTIQIDQETIRCVTSADCNVGQCLASAEPDLYQLPLTSTDVECRELNFTLDAATITGGVSPAQCTGKRCYGGTNDPATDQCNSGEVTGCPDSGSGTYCTGDADYDGVCDVDVGTDNCNPFIDCKANPRDCYNPDQRDSGGIIGKGDVCDITCASDTDSDGICDATDICRNVYNPSGGTCIGGHTNKTNGQCDYDLDRIGDACDPCTDADLDGFWDINTPANTCQADNCSPSAGPASDDRLGYCTGNLSIQCQVGTGGNNTCAGAGAGSCAQKTGNLATYNPYQEDYDGDGKGYICDYCLDFDGDNHGDYPFYTGSIANTNLTPNQRAHFGHCTTAVPWPGTPGDVNDIDNCPGGPFGAKCADEFGIEISCANPSGITWVDVYGTPHTGQRDYDLDGIGDICENAINNQTGVCGNGIIDDEFDEVCDCGEVNLPVNPNQPGGWTCTTLNNDSNCTAGYNETCNYCLSCSVVAQSLGSSCGDGVVDPGEACDCSNNDFADADTQPGGWTCNSNNGNRNCDPVYGGSGCKYCANSCGAISTTPSSVCGDGVANLGNEACDDGPGGVCKDDCTGPYLTGGPGGSPKYCNNSSIWKTGSFTFIPDATFSDNEQATVSIPACLVNSATASMNFRSIYEGQSQKMGIIFVTDYSGSMNAGYNTVSSNNGTFSCSRPWDDAAWNDPAGNNVVNVYDDCYYRADGKTCYFNNVNKTWWDGGYDTNPCQITASLDVGKMNSLVYRRIDHLRVSLKEAVNTLFNSASGNDVYIGLSKFSDSLSWTVPVDKNNKQTLINAINTYTDPTGGTQTSRGVINAYDLLNDLDNSLGAGTYLFKNIIVLSDGYANLGEYCQTNPITGCAWFEGSQDVDDCNSYWHTHDWSIHEHHDNIYQCTYNGLAYVNGVGGNPGYKSEGIEFYSVVVGTANTADMLELSSNTVLSPADITCNDDNYCYTASNAGDLYELYQTISNKIANQNKVDFKVRVGGIGGVGGVITEPSITKGGVETEIVNIPTNFCTITSKNLRIENIDDHLLAGTIGETEIQIMSNSFQYCPVCDTDDDNYLADYCGGPDCQPDNNTIPAVEGLIEGNCSDGIDNDCDGQTDSADLQCATTQVEICTNGIDDDGDGQVDAADLDCQLSSPVEICNNGIDDDGNGLIDLTDPECSGGGTGVWVEICTNGIDDDRDGRADCADLECQQQAGPNGATCCQTVSDCSTFGTGQCNTCSSNICVGVTAVNGTGCEGACSFCSNGACINRETGDGRECPAGWACTGSVPAYCSLTVSAEICNQPGDEDGDGLADCEDVADCGGHLAPDGGICCTTNSECSGTCQTCSTSIGRCVDYSGLNGQNCSSACTYCSNGTCQPRSNGDGLECPAGQICSGSSCVEPGATNQCTVPSSKACALTAGVCAGAIQACVVPGVWPGCDFQTYVNYAASTGKTYEAGFESLCTDSQDNDCDGLKDGLDPDCQVACNDNGSCDAGENCSNCPDECPCLPGQLCCGLGTFSCQAPACNADVQCNDSNPLTTDTCQNPASCNAVCVHTTITACINDDGACPAGCTYANDNDCSPVATCSDTDGGNNNYNTQGTVTDGVGGIVFTDKIDSCSANLLTEYGCSGNNFTSTTYNCASIANTICSNGACVLQTGTNSCADTDGGVTYTTVGTVSGQTSGVSYTHTDICASSTALTEWSCSGNQPVSSTPAFDCTVLGAGYTCSNGRCVPPAPVFVNYYCDSDSDGAVSTAITVNCQQGTANCPPVGQGCVTAPGSDCNDANNEVYPGASEVSCNGVNNDCDAQTDEDYVPAGSTCGVGACAATGQLVCQSGSINNTCTPLPPSNEVCGDGIDNDCNGTVDNGCVNECVPGATIACGVLDPVNYKGVCSTPTITCNALGAWPRSECTAQSKTSEVGFCTDNLDNDCDGLADCQETINCPAGNVCGGNCLAGATCNVSSGPTQYDWICNAQPNSFCGGTGNACGLCVEVSAGTFQCQANASACSGFQCGVCQDQGTGTDYSCAPNNNACTNVCTTCNPSTLSCDTVINAQDTDGVNQCHDNVGCAGNSCSCSVAGVCQNCEDYDGDGLCNEIDVCPYDPNNDLDYDTVCAVGCFTGLSIFDTDYYNGWICDSNATNVARDVCQGGPNQDSPTTGIVGVPDSCENSSCKVVFGAQDYLNLYINGKLVTGNLSLPKYVGGNPPASVIDNVFVNLDSFVQSGENVIAIEAYVEKARGSYPDYTAAYRQIRGAFAKITDPACGSNGCALCDAAGFNGVTKRTDSAEDTTSALNMPLKCFVANDSLTAPAPGWRNVGFNDSTWEFSDSGTPKTDSGEEVMSRLWYNNNFTRYDSPRPVWGGNNNYSATSKVYCRHTFIK